MTKGKFKNGHIPWNTGKKRPDIAGSKNPNWKGGMPYCKNCDKKLATKNSVTGLCMKCYQSILRPMDGNSLALGNKLSAETKSKMSESRGGDKHWNWKGGVIKTERYVKIKKEDHPFKNKYGYVYEHRLVVEKYIKRFLKPEEVVHHINKNGYDNKITNLMLFSLDKFHRKYEFNKPVPQNSIIFDGRKTKRKVKKCQNIQ